MISCMISCMFVIQKKINFITYNKIYPEYLFNQLLQNKNSTYYFYFYKFFDNVYITQTYIYYINDIMHTFKRKLFGDSGLIPNAGSNSTKKIIVRDEHKGFVLIDNLPQLLQLINTDNPSYFHEVILQDSPRKLAFDIDLTIPNVNYSLETEAYTSAYNGLFTYISRIEKNINNINKINDNNLLTTYNDLISLNQVFEELIINNLQLAFDKTFKNISESHINHHDTHMLYDSKPYVSYSHGFDIKMKSYKFSLHIVYPIIVSNYLEQKELANTIIDCLPDPLQSIFDRAIYKKTFMLRLIGSTKKNTFRIKKPSELKCHNIAHDNGIKYNHIVSDIDFGYMMVWPTSILRISKIYKINKYGDVHVNTDRIYNINANYIEKSQNLSYKYGNEISDLDEDEKQAVLNNVDGVILTSYNNSIRLHRNQTGYCKICSKQHDTDHGYVIKNPIGVFVGCYRSIQYHNKYKLLPVITYKTDNIIPNENNDIKSEVPENITNNIVELNCKYFDSSVYSDNLINNDILFIKSGTGSGKSASLRKYMEELIKTENNELRVLMISYRRSLSVEQYRNYQSLGFKHYELDKQELHGNLCSTNRLIIQVESLYKLQSYNYKPYDLLILDEVNKTVEQLNSGLCRNPHGNKAILYSILKTQKIIGIDAFLNNNSIKCIAQFRKEITDRHASVSDLDYKLIHNIYKHKSDRVYYNVNNKYLLIQNIIGHVEYNKKIFIASNSRLFAEEVYHMLNKQFNTITNKKSIKIYHGKSDNKLKDELFNVNDNWKVDILIYTSVIEAGNSFDEKWFDIGFMYFTNKSTNHLGCLQMTDRIRNLSSNTCYFHINERNHYYQDVNHIEERLNIASFAAEQNIHNSWILYSKYRESSKDSIKIRKDEAYYTFVRNIDFDNYSKFNFRKLMIQCWTSTGIKIMDHIVDDVEGNIIKETETKKILLKTKITLKNEKIDSIIKANVNSIVTHDSELDEHAKTKLRLIKVYDVPESKIDKVFVTKYNKVPLLRGYSTRKKILQFGNIEKYKANLISKYNELNSEYTSIEKKYKQSKYVDKILSLDVLEILTDNKTMDIIKDPHFKLTVEKAVLEIRINTVLNNISNAANSCKFKMKLLKARHEHKIRVINELLTNAIDIKICRIKFNKKSKNINYHICVCGFVS